MDSGKVEFGLLSRVGSRKPFAATIETHALYLYGGWECRSSLCILHAFHEWNVWNSTMSPPILNPKLFKLNVFSSTSISSKFISIEIGSTIKLATINNAMDTCDCVNRFIYHVLSFMVRSTLLEVEFDGT